MIRASRGFQCTPRHAHGPPTCSGCANASPFKPNGPLDWVPSYRHDQGLEGSSAHPGMPNSTHLQRLSKRLLQRLHVQAGHDASAGEQQWREEAGLQCRGGQYNNVGVSLSLWSGHSFFLLLHPGHYAFPFPNIRSRPFAIERYHQRNMLHLLLDRRRQALTEQRHGTCSR